MKSTYFILAILVVCPTILFAQEVIASGEALYNSTFSLTNGTIMGAAIKAKKGNKAGSTTNTSRERKTTTSSGLAFVRSEPLSKNIQQDFIARISKDQPSIKPALDNAFSDNKLRNQFDRLLAGYGYSAKNLSDVMTAYLVINWQVIHGQEYNDRRGFDAVRRMITQNLSENDHLQNVSDKDKQTVAETLGYQSMIAMSTYKALAAKGDQTALNKFRQTVYENAKQSGIDLKAYRLTANGFVKE
jgi:hypothetical protein